MRSLLLTSLFIGAGLCQSRSRTQTMWGQCGGRDYTGASACPTGAFCMNDGNEWYSQCIPIDSLDDDDDDDGDGDDWGDSIITRTIGTIFSVGGPTPTVVTTFITFLTPSSTPPPHSTATTVTLTPDEPITTFWPRAPRGS